MASPVEIGILRAMQGAAAARDVEASKERQLAAMMAQERQLAAEVETLTERLAATRTGGSEVVEQIPAAQAQAAQVLPTEAASAMVDIAAMMQTMPTEALAGLLARLRASNNAAVSTTASSPNRSVARAPTAIPSSLNPGEATALVDIMGMMRDMPTPALADLLQRLRALPGAAAAPAPRELSGGPPRVEAPEGPQLAMPPREAPKTAAPPIASAAAMRSGRARLLRSILVAFFMKHDAQRLEDVEELVAHVVGDSVKWADEDELFEDLEVEYGVPFDLDPHDRD